MAECFCMMDGWMDRCMDGWMDDQIDRRTVDGEGFTSILQEQVTTKQEGIK